MTVRVVLAGGTGLVGSHVAAIVAERSDLALTSLVRGTARPGETAIDFEELVSDSATAMEKAAPGGWDIAICCLGTMLAAAGSKEAMWRVDHDYVIAFARGARAAGARQLILMSAAGAGGMGFYLRTKGMVETAAAKLGFERLDVIRPGLILGPRRNRSLGAAIGAAIYPWLAPLFPGPLAKYRGIKVSDVATAMTELIGAPSGGNYVHHNRELRRIADRP